MKYDLYSMHKDFCNSKHRHQWTHLKKVRSAQHAKKLLTESKIISELNRIRTGYYCVTARTNNYSIDNYHFFSIHNDQIIDIVPNSTRSNTKE